MTKRDTQFPQDATALEEPLHPGDDAPSDAPAPSSTPEAADPPPEPGPPALLDFPVAAVLPPVAPLLHAPTEGSPLEARIQRVEAELAQLRAAQTGASRPAANAGFHAATPETAAPPPARFWAGLGKRLGAPSGPSAVPPRPESLASMVPPGVRRGWILWDALTELRAIYWMICDPRYRLSWTGRLAPVVVLVMIFTSGFWLPLSGLSYVGFIIEKVADLVLAYVLFKLLSHESRRYRETAPDLPQSLRL